MERDTLLKRLEELGYPLLGKSINANEVLAEVVKSNDARLLQGFPVLLANMINKNMFNFKEVMSFLTNQREVNLFIRLLIMSSVLFKRRNIHLDTESYRNEIDMRDHMEIRNNIDNSFWKDKYIHGLENYLSWDKVMNTFDNYYRNYVDSNFKNYLAIKDETDLEFALSQIFSSKQKDIVKRKIRGEKLSKTDREYYSRVIRKKDCSFGKLRPS